jgi:RNA polymerase sigma-70 factor (ECF subfamily)
MMLDARADDWLSGFSAQEPWLRSWLHRKWPTVDIDDAVQDIYMRLLHKPPAGTVQSHRAMLVAIGRSVAIDQLRRMRVRAVCVSFDEALHDRECPEPLADERYDARRRLDRVMSSLGELPDRHRQVVMLRRVEGMRAKHVAEELGLSVSSIEKLLSASMKRLVPEM